MWGKLNQMVSGEQQRIDNLESQLQEEQVRNKTINEQFKKVLKDKEVIYLYFSYDLHLISMCLIVHKQTFQ